jgi:hypothetical protein
MTRLLLVVLLTLLLVAYNPPPALPSCFYGAVFGSHPGALVATNFDGTALVGTYEGRDGYQLCATGGAEGARVFFTIDGGLAGSSYYHAGTNQRRDLRVLPSVMP